jgi:lipoate-protein ligase A
LGKAKAAEEEVTNIEAMRRRVQAKKKLQEFEEKLQAPSRDKLIQQAYRELEEEDRKLSNKFSSKK